MVVPRSIFQYGPEYLTLHEPQTPKDAICYSCEQQFGNDDWIYSNYNGLRLLRRHLGCAYQKNLITYKEARALNKEAPPPEALTSLPEGKMVVIDYTKLPRQTAIAALLYREQDRPLTTVQISRMMAKEGRFIHYRNVSKIITSEKDSLKKLIEYDFCIEAEYRQHIVGDIETTNFCPFCGSALYKFDLEGRKQHVDAHRGIKLTPEGIKWYKETRLGHKPSQVGALINHPPPQPVAPPLQSHAPI